MLCRVLNFTTPPASEESSLQIMQSVSEPVPLIPGFNDVTDSKPTALTSNYICTPSSQRLRWFPHLGRTGGVGGSSEEDRGWKGTGKQMASYLSLLCEGCHSNRLMQGSGKEKKRQRQSRKGLVKTIGPRATGQICRLGHNRWSFFNRQGQLL